MLVKLAEPSNNEDTRDNTNVVKGQTNNIDNLDRLTYLSDLVTAIHETPDVIEHLHGRSIVSDLTLLIMKVICFVIVFEQMSLTDVLLVVAIL